MKRYFLKEILLIIAIIMTFSLTGCTIPDESSKNEAAAYKLWLEKGNKGTNKDFLDWIKKTENKDKKKKDAGYETWIKEGNKGTEADFLKWIKEVKNKKDDNKEEKNIAYTTWLNEGNKGTEKDFLNWIKDANNKVKEDDEKPEKPSIYKNAEFKSLTVEYNEMPHEIKVEGAPKGTEIEYVNNKATNVGRYRAFVRLYKEEEEKLMTAVLNITKINIKDVSFNDLSVVYDGTTKNIAVTGDVPEDVAIKYTIDKTPFEGATNVGTYNVTAELSGNNYNTLILTAKLEITRAEIENITFNDSSVVYDGETKNIKVLGDIPEGIEVKYEVNETSFKGAKNVGIYNITATLIGSNYNTLTLAAKLEIEKADITGITFKSTDFFEDGKNKSIEITGEMPEGVSVKYMLNNETFSGIAEVGSHPITAVLEGSNYNTLTLNAMLTIKKNKITGVTFENASAQYDGTLKHFGITGTLPDGVSVTYKIRWGGEFNGATEIGTYDVIATLTGKYHETLILEAKFVITPNKLDKVTGVTIVKEGINISLNWNAVQNSSGYEINIYSKDRTLIITGEVGRGITSYDIRREMLANSVLSGNYFIEVIAIPRSDDTQYAPSEPSDAVTYQHAGVLSVPQNVRIEDGALKWDTVPDAGVYGLRIAFCDSEGNILRSRGGNYLAEEKGELKLDIIKQDFSLESGYYKFMLRAYPIDPGSAGSSNPIIIPNRVSQFSSYTELVKID